MALRDILSQGPTIKIKRNGRIETEKILLIRLVMVVKANQLNRTYWVNIEGHSIKTICQHCNPSCSRQHRRSLLAGVCHAASGDAGDRKKSAPCSETGVDGGGLQRCSETPEYG